MRKMLMFPQTPEQEGSEELPQNENAENAENLDAKMQNMRLTAFIVTGFRLSGFRNANAKRRVFWTQAT